MDNPKTDALKNDQAVILAAHKYHFETVDFVWQSHLFIPGLKMSTQELFKMLPYIVTIIVLVIVSVRKKREDQPPASLGLSYFREDR